MINHISVYRFKTLRQASLRLRSLNLLAGMNGMGKSTLIQSLLLLRQSWQARTLPSDGLLLRGNLADLGRGEDILYQFAEEETIEFALMTDNGSFRWAFDVGESACDHEVLPLLGEPVPITAYADSLFGKGFRYLSSERMSPKVTSTTSVFAVREQDELGIHGEFTAHYLAEHQSRPVAIPQLIHANLNEEKSDLLSNVRAWLDEISPGITLNAQQYPQMQIAAISYNYDVGAKAGLPIGILPPNVGFGISYILPILVAILSSNPGDLVLIENPECHLHPRGQSTIGRLLAILAGCDVQVIVESHSDHVVNGMRLAVKEGLIAPNEVGLFFFDRAKGDPAHAATILTPSVDANGKVDFWPLGFFDETERILYKLL